MRKKDSTSRVSRKAISRVSPPAESKQDKTRRELLERLRATSLAHALKTCEVAVARAGVDGERLARHNIRKGDVVNVSLDGDAEHGELAFVTWYDLDDERRYWTTSFLVVEGDHFCLRETRLECDGEHHEPDRITIIGRAVSVERGGLPVRLKDLELRGLPYAEDLPFVEDDEEGGAE